MRMILKIFAVLFLPALSSSQTTYYVSASGSNSNPGTIGSPWKTIQYAVATPAAGDIVLFNRGETFVGTITPKAGSTYGAYGNGLLPKIGPVDSIPGGHTPGNWITLGGGLYQWHTAINWNNVILDGVLYPWAPTQGGVNAAMRWFHTEQEGGDGTGNKGSGTLTVYSSGNPATTYSLIQTAAATYDYAVYAGNGVDNCTFENLMLWGGSGSDQTVLMVGCTGWTFRGCNIGNYADGGAVRLEGQCDNATFTYSTIDRKTPHMTWDFGGNGGGDGVMIYGGGQGPGSGILFDHCTLVNLRHGSINIFPSAGLTANFGEVRYCDFDGGTSDYSYAFVTHSWQLSPPNLYGWKFHHNRVHNFTIMPMEIRSHGLEIYENLFDHNSCTQWEGQGFWNNTVIGIFSNTEGVPMYSRNVHVFNNVFAYNETPALSIGNNEGTGASIGPDSIYIENNFFYQNGTNTSLPLGSGLGGLQFWTNNGMPANKVFVFRNNAMYDTRGAFGIYRGYTDGTHHDYSWWVQGNADANDLFAGNIGSDPVFNNGYHIGSTSSGKDAGLAPTRMDGSTGYSGLDYYGGTVPNGTPDIGIHEYGGSVPPVTPTITVTANNPMSFGNVLVSDHSPSQTYNVSGADLNTGLTIIAPPEFEISTGDGTWHTSMYVGGAGTLASTLVYVRVSPTSQGSKAGSILNSSGGATTVDVSVTGMALGIPEQSNIRLRMATKLYSPTAVTRIATPILIEGSDRHILASIAYWTNTSGKVDSVKLKTSGQAPTQLIREGAGNSGFIEIWSLNKPDLGSDSVIFWGTFTDVEAGAMAFTGVDESSPTGMVKADLGNSNNASVTVSASLGDLIVDALYSFQAAYLVGSGQIQTIYPHSPDFDTDLSCSMRYAHQGQNVMSWRLSVAQIWAQTAVVLKAKIPPVPAGPRKVVLVSRSSGKYLLITRGTPAPPVDLYENLYDSNGVQLRTSSGQDLRVPK